MQTTINERLKILVDALGTNQNALAVMLGLSPSTFRNYTDRESKPGYEVLEKLYHSFKHINLYWLFGEPGEPLLPNAAEPTAPYGTAKKISRAIVVGGNVGGSATNNQGASANEQALQREVELLRSQVADKDEIISLLKRQLPKP